MPRKQDIDHPHADHRQAQREQDARTRLQGLDADAPDPPPSAVDLVQLAVRRRADLDPQDILSALTLLPAAHTDVDGLESALLFMARSEGLTWAQIAHAMGFNSPQACQQRYTRLAARQDTDS